MVAVVVHLNVAPSFLMNLQILILCLLCGLLVHLAAPVLYRMRGWKRVATRAVLSVVWLAMLTSISAPQIASVVGAFFMECGCNFWFEMCCYF